MPSSVKNNGSPKNKNAPKNAPKTASKSAAIATGVKIKGEEVFHTQGLKNPLGGFFVKRDGKKVKIAVSKLNKNTAEKLVSKLNSKDKIPPKGKVLNPETGRFVKPKQESKTFQDPITMVRTKKENGIELNKQMYSKQGLRGWVNAGSNTVPHSRRKITNAEMNKIYTNKNGTKVQRKIIKSNNNNNFSNNNYNSNNNNYNSYNNNSGEGITPLHAMVGDDVEVIENSRKTFETFEDFKKYIIKLNKDMEEKNIGWIEDEKITIRNRPGYEITMDAMRMVLYDIRSGHHIEYWLDLRFTIKKPNGTMERIFVEKNKDHLSGDLIRRLAQSMPSQNNSPDWNKDFVTMYPESVIYNSRKTFETFLALKYYIDGLPIYMNNENISGIKNEKITIDTMPGYVLTMTASRFAKGSNTWLKLEFQGQTPSGNIIRWEVNDWGRRGVYNNNNYDVADHVAEHAGLNMWTD